MLKKSSCSDRVLSNGVSLPPIMLGSFQVDSSKIMLSMLETAVSKGCFGFDTAPSYGSEKILGEAVCDACLQSGFSREQFFISDKIDGMQMFHSNGEVEKYVDESLKIMKLDYMDLLLVHWPFEKYLLNTWKCFERMYKSGKVRAIGLCNTNIRIMEELRKNEIEVMPHVIQNEISPLRIGKEEITYFQNMNITVEAYSPLCRMIKPISESAVLREIADKYNKSIAQIILRWNIERDIIPIFVSKKPERILSNLDIFDFKLLDSDIETINSLNQNYKIFPESYGCPGY